ncbi:MAG: hypothetical protein QM758_01720 [Armatimonas sp.]
MPLPERPDWTPDSLYVVGHQRPDTDAIAAALGYAWLLKQTGPEHAVAARCGPPGDQARYALERFEQSSPRCSPALRPRSGMSWKSAPRSARTLR